MEWTKAFKQLWSLLSSLRQFEADVTAGRAADHKVEAQGVSPSLGLGTVWNQGEGSFLSPQYCRGHGNTPSSPSSADGDAALCCLLRSCGCAGAPTGSALASDLLQNTPSLPHDQLGWNWHFQTQFLTLTATVGFSSLPLTPLCAGGGRLSSFHPGDGLREGSTKVPTWFQEVPKCVWVCLSIITFSQQDKHPKTLSGNNSLLFLAFAAG